MQIQSACVPTPWIPYLNSIHACGDMHNIEHGSAELCTFTYSNNLSLLIHYKIHLHVHDMYTECINVQYKHATYVCVC